MPTYQVILERNLCTSCGNCFIECPEYFQMDQEGLSHLLKSERTGDNEVLKTDKLGCLLDAALSCPVICIHVYENGEEMT